MDGNAKPDFGRPKLQLPHSPEELSKSQVLRGLSALHHQQQQPKTPIPQSPAVPPSNHTDPLYFPPPQSSGSSGVPSPATPSPSGPQSPDKVHNLPQELLDAGWRRFWSRREGKEYFYNKFTKQSLWDQPPIGSPVGATRHDPLGIQIDLPAGADPNANAASLDSSGSGGVKRRHSTQEEPLSPSLKTADLKGPFWDFTLMTNAQIYERSPCKLPPPHNDTELLRANLTNRLRMQYQELCSHRESINAPKESFNRWLMERKVIDKGLDPMLPSNCNPVVSPSMMREIMSDIPVKLYRPKMNNDARLLLSKYTESAMKMVEKRSVTPESRKVVKWNADDTFRWLRTQPYSSIDDYMKRLAHLKEECGPHLCAAAKSSVEGICTKMYNLSCEAVKRLHSKHWELLKEHQIEEPPETDKAPPKKKYQCYAIQMMVPSPRLPNVDVQEDGEMTVLRYNNGDRLKISKQHLKKLDLLYRIHCREDPFRHNFLPRVWCLLRRYQTYFGTGESEGHSQQGALPARVLKTLSEQFGVTFEWFASPLNCYFKQYCSAFPDTDGYFGSRGPMLDFHPFSGSFEANPPFGEELMESMVRHFEKLLGGTTEPMSITVFIPDWRNPVPEALRMLEASRFKRRQVTFPAFEHEYRSGAQHYCQSSSVHIKAVHGTIVMFLQNDAGFKIWGPNEKKVRALLDAFQMGNEEALNNSHRTPQRRDSKIRKIDLEKETEDATNNQPSSSSSSSSVPLKSEDFKAAESKPD
ncbi:mRNA (2'-O-methyladenosine-N(6)-)-methyltransferase-like [Apostichopus japonicus]|uniref:mRNA (2'-O-methyladenosine-N(6)-)-methyltransferase-like n=1 Tax=Stichopus japonicus TaxID=307972 RepID=UPI003AB3F77C